MKAKTKTRTLVGLLLIFSVCTLPGVHGGSRLEFESQASVVDITPPHLRQLQLQQAQGIPDLEPPVPNMLGSELLYVTPIKYQGRPPPSSNPGSADGDSFGSSAAALDGGVDYDEFMSGMHTFVSDMRDTLMSVPQNLGNALLSTWEANAEHARRKAAEAERRKPKKPLVHFGKPITVKKMDMKKVYTHMHRPHAPIIIQVVMPTPAPTPTTPEPSPAEAASEQAAKEHDRTRGRPRPPRRRWPLRNRQIPGLLGIGRRRQTQKSGPKPRNAAEAARPPPQQQQKKQQRQAAPLPSPASPPPPRSGLGIKFLGLQL